eukprot:TRINITY_DN7913_c0_g1_i1.p1 TRINITY_DN7913_c0_g1~~TRINITY_DN7913_c0_g1_i1.p1  ORF type:complete len:317 (+),score=77.49 TRINITY_DN7913_c0_g1_i1:48-998(+)
MGGSCMKFQSGNEMEIAISADDNIINEHQGKPRIVSDLEEQFNAVIRGISHKSIPVKEKLATLEPFIYQPRDGISELTIKENDDSTPGELYTGFWDPILNSREYKGIIQYEDGSFFEGHFVQGKIQGKGRKIYAQLDIYIGDYVNNQAEGKGKYVHPDGSYYDGDWKQDVRDGEGVEVIQGQQIYKGQFKNSVKQGKGVCEFEDKAVYDGDFNNGVFEGKGSITYADGKKYEGDWKEGKKNGTGKLIFAKGHIYEGGFLNDKQHGQGKFIWANNEQIEVGEWKNGKKEGTFLITKSDGKSIKVIMQEGKPINTLDE